MVRGNYAVPNVHLHKHWNPSGSQKGHVKTFFNQAPQKKQRRIRRAEKAKKVFPRPVSSLRPLVRCPSQRYNIRKRLGRGFTHEELKAAKLAPRFARTVGISVDHRRVNKSEESKNENVQRLKEYMANLVIYPTQGSKKKRPTAAAVQVKARILGKTPSEASKPAHEAPRALTAEEKSRHIYQYLRKVLRDNKFVGLRELRKKRKEENKKNKKTEK